MLAALRSTKLSADVIDHALNNCVNSVPHLHLIVSTIILILV